MSDGWIKFSTTTVIAVAALVVGFIQFGTTSVDPASSTLPVSLLEQPASVAHACRDLLSAKWNSGVLKWFKQQ